VKCTGCKKDESGKITEVYCEYDPDTKSGMPGSERKVKGTLHWVNINNCLPCEVRLYDRLFMVENPALEEKEHDFRELLNPESLKVINGFVEPYVKDMPVISYLQFQRIGYFDVDYDSTPDHLVFNKTVGLKDSWGKIQNKK